MNNDLNAMKAEIERLKAENQRLTAKSNGPLTLRVSEKGGLSVYGMGRFPVTLYASQWEKLNGEMPRIMSFIETNRQTLRTKDQG